MFLFLSLMISVSGIEIAVDNSNSLLIQIMVWFEYCG